MISLPKTIKLFMCDFNWVYLDTPFVHTPPSSAHDWAFVEPQKYFDWHREFGVNMMFCQAYTSSGVSFYPSRLGPNAPAPGNQLLPRLHELSQKAGVPFCSYFCVGADFFTSNVREHWLVPGSRKNAHYGFLAPESPWTDLLCARVAEFLQAYPVEVILFDWFVYGSLTPDYLVQPGWFVEKPFAEIIGRPMPKDAADISEAESLRYKREVLAQQFYRIRDTVEQSSPATQIGFNVPFWKAAEDLWVDHPMLQESDILFAESTREEVMDWLLQTRKPTQRVMTTIIGRLNQFYQLDRELCAAASWRKWYELGFDFSGYAWGTPPDFRPHPGYATELEIVRRAYAEIPSS